MQVGDVVLSWNDFAATDPTLLSRKIASTEIGSTAKVVVARRGGPDGKRDEIELSVKMERRPPDKSP
jgi:S1-C subfamily serine protease